MIWFCLTPKQWVSLFIITLMKILFFSNQLSQHSSRRKMISLIRSPLCKNSSRFYGTHLSCKLISSTNILFVYHLLVYSCIMCDLFILLFFSLFYFKSNKNFVDVLIILSPNDDKTWFSKWNKKKSCIIFLMRKVFNKNLHLKVSMHFKTS